jgi:hypothetical protein
MLDNSSAPNMLSDMRSRVFLSCVVVLLALVGCAPQPAPVTAPTTTTPSPTTTPDPVAERIVIRAESIAVIADDGSTLSEFDYFQPAEDVVPVLDAVLGISAVEQETNGAGDVVTTYDWGGLELIDDASAVEAPYYSDLFFAASADAIGGIAIETVDGVQVGDAGPELEARYPDESHRVTAGDSPERIDLYLDFVDHPDEEFSEEFGGVAVWVIVEPAEGPVTEIRAPSPVSTGWDWFNDLL